MSDCMTPRDMIKTGNISSAVKSWDARMEFSICVGASFHLIYAFTTVDFNLRSWGWRHPMSTFKYLLNSFVCASIEWRWFEYFSLFLVSQRFEVKIVAFTGFKILKYQDWFGFKLCGLLPPGVRRGRISTFRERFCCRMEKWLARDLVVYI